MPADTTRELAGELRIGGSNSPIGSKRIALLEQIESTGSITAAARAVGLSYKGAWDAVHAMNNLADSALVIGSTGGSDGGGSRLSARGEQLVRVYRAAAEEQARFLERLNRRVDTLDDDLNLMGRLAMQTSARNQLYGQVVSINPGSVNTEVVISLAGGTHLAATITRASSDHLAIEPDVDVTALIKASWIVIAGGDPSQARLSTRNQIAGTIESITTDDVNAEVVLRLAGNNMLAAVITRDSLDAMALVIGETATALFKASSVILARPD